MPLEDFLPQTQGCVVKLTSLLNLTIAMNQIFSRLLAVYVGLRTERILLQLKE